MQQFQAPNVRSFNVAYAKANCVYADQPRSSNSKKFSLVPALPSPTPSELGPAAVKQLMTWGTLNATPRILTSDDPAESSMPPPNVLFHLPAPSSREVISRKLSSSASKSLRVKAELMGGRTPGISRTPSMLNRTKGTMGPPTWTPKRAEAAGGLTPAAKRLLDRTMATRRSEAMERASNWQGNKKAKEKDANRIRWTPTPSPITRRE
jgi:protein DGCR14